MSAAQKQSAVEFLKKEHQQVMNAFSEFESLGERAYVGKKKLADQICEDLLQHTLLEEEVLYPTIRGSVKAGKQMANEAKVEHDSAKQLIVQIQEMQPEEELFDAKVHVLSEYIEHHVKEEEDEMFPALKSSNLDLDALGEQLVMAKQALQAK